MKSFLKYLPLIAILSLVSCFGSGNDSDDNSSYQYHTPEEVNLFLEQTETNYPGIAHVEDVGTSAAGRKIKALIISDNPETLEGEPAVRLTGGIHGDEMMGVELLLRFIEYLTSNYNSSSTVKSIVDSRYICIIPVLNPDGLARKNRTNYNGIDLNRNFNETGSSLQPETKALQDFSSSKSFCISITYHTGAVLLNMPFDYGSEKIDGIAPVENTLVKAYALTYTNGTGSVFLTNPDVFIRIYNSIYGDYIYLDKGTINGGDWYVITGSLQDWSYTETGCLDFTIEVTKSNPSTEVGVQQVFMYNRDSLMAYISKSGDGIYGRVTDGTNGIANVEITASWSNGGTITGDIIIKTDSKGYYHRIFLPGTYDLTFTKTGYTSQTQTGISVTDSTLLNVTMN